VIEEGPRRPTMPHVGSGDLLDSPVQIQHQQQQQSSGLPYLNTRRGTEKGGVPPGIR